MRATSDELAIFIAVVENGSFSRAALQLKLGNSAVSRAVKRLEEKLGVNLLNRTTRQLSLTREGSEYFCQVQHLMQEMQEVENELIENRKTPRGLLRIDAAMPVLLHLILPLIKSFQSQYPDIKLALISSETYINLIDHKVDIAIRAGDLTDSTLRSRPLIYSYRKLVASPSYIAEHGEPESVEELIRHRCIGFTEPQQLNHWPLINGNGEHQSVTMAMTANSGETIKHLCLAGNGIACLSDFLVDTEIAAGLLVPILGQSLQPLAMPVSAVYYAERAVSPRIRAFIDFSSAWFAAGLPK